MSLSTSEKDSRIGKILSEQLETFGSNPIHIPVSVFNKLDGFSEDDAELALVRLQNQGVILEIHQVEGFYFSNPKPFGTGRREFQKMYDYVRPAEWVAKQLEGYGIEAKREQESMVVCYEIRIDQAKLATLQEKEGNIKIKLTKKGVYYILSTEKGSTLSYKMSSSVKKKIIDYFWTNRNKGLIKAQKIASRLDVQPTAKKSSVQVLRDEIGKINDSMEEKFHFGEGLINSGHPKEEGYSFNLKFEIEITHG